MIDVSAPPRPAPLVQGRTHVIVAFVVVEGGHMNQCPRIPYRLILVHKHTAASSLQMDLAVSSVPTWDDCPYIGEDRMYNPEGCRSPYNSLAWSWSYYPW